MTISPSLDNAVTPDSNTVSSPAEAVEAAGFAAAHPLLRQALQARGYATPTEVQKAVLAAPAARDLLVSAQTGSGKTVAFGLAIAPLLMQQDELPAAHAPGALVIAPTRELALQVRDELAWLYAPAGARIASCVGGMDPRREREVLARGCHIVVGTPGRLRDHLERGNLDLAHLRAAVLDEADEMLDLGFREDLEFILAACAPDRRTFLFSATIDASIAALARGVQRDALRLDTVRRDAPHADISYRAHRIANRSGEAERATVNVLRFHASPGALVFCATRDGVRHMHASLQERGFAAVALSGELSQAERSRALLALRDGRAQVCIATDVAARGLDLPSLDLVIHADLPGSAETLLHRSGRTGRAGRKGTSVVLVPAARWRRAQGLFAQARIAAIAEPPPSGEAIRARDEDRLLADPAFAQPPLAEEQALAARLLAAMPAEAALAGLLRLVQSRAPAAEDLQQAQDTARDTGYKARDPSRRDTGSSSRHDKRRADSQTHDPERPDAPRPDMAARRAAFASGGVRFRVRLGRRDKADPKWLLPLLCRRGNVDRDAIGRIEIGDDASLFEIAATAADRFRSGIAREVAADEAHIAEVGIATRARMPAPGSVPGPRAPHRKGAGQASTRKARRPG